MELVLNAGPCHFLPMANQGRFENRAVVATHLEVENGTKIVQRNASEVSNDLTQNLKQAQTLDTVSASL